MRFLRKNEPTKTVLIVSDLHLSAGANIGLRRNFLEDFHSDKELVEFIQFFSSNEYQGREVDLIINGDFLDFLAVPYVRFFDDEFWSEAAALEKLKMIVEAHPEVIEAMEKFLRVGKKSIVYIIGNHDAEMILEKVQEYFLSLFTDGVRPYISVTATDNGDYWALPGVLIKHGHEYELAHHFHPKTSVVVDDHGKRYFLPPWGSYYVTRVVNRFKEDRGYINAVRPVRKFLISGLAYDPLFTLRFIFASIFYFIMVRFIYTFRQGNTFKTIIQRLKQELKLFQNYEDLTENFLHDNPDIQALIVGHSHDPTYRVYPHGAIFINTGTWTKMINLDFDKRDQGLSLNFAQVDVMPLPKGEKRSRHPNHRPYAISLNVWKGTQHLPYQEFN